MTVEALLVHNVLNEVLRGIPGHKFGTLQARQREIGVLEARVEGLPIESLTPPERRLLGECITTVVEALGDDEFETRVGVEIGQAREFARLMAA